MTNSKNHAELKAELKAKTDKLVSQDKELFANLSKEEIIEKKKERAKNFKKDNRFLLDELKTQKKESKEIFTKSLEFEWDTFKVDTTWWNEKTRGFYIWKMKCKLDSDQFIIEYFDENFDIFNVKWEQIFITYSIFVREVMKAKNCSKEEVEKKYLMTVDEFKEKMKDKPSDSDEYKEFFNKEIASHLSGWTLQYDATVSDVWDVSVVWLAGGSQVVFYPDKFVIREVDGSHSYYPYYKQWCSGRLLKN